MDLINVQQYLNYFNTNYFWQNKNSRLRFIYLVIFTYNIILEEFYKRVPNVNENNLNIMFKGGNVLRIVIQEFIENFEYGLKNLYSYLGYNKERLLLKL